MNNLKNLLKNKIALILAIIFIIALLAVVLYKTNTIQRIYRAIYTRVRAEEIENVITYRVYDNQDNKNLKVFLKVSNSIPIEYIEKSDGTKISINGKAETYLDYTTELDKEEIFKIKPINGQEVENIITITQSDINKYCNIEDVTGESYANRLELDYTELGSEETVYYKVGKEATEWVKYTETIVLTPSSIENITEGSGLNVKGTTSIFIKKVDTVGNIVYSENECILTFSNPKAEVGAATHTPKALTCSWDIINEIARAVSSNYDEKTGSEQITQNTEEVILGDYIVGVGDTISVGGYTARVLGFNQDPLATTGYTDQYGDGKTHTYAGISFEFVSFLMYSTWHGTVSNTGGWGGCTLRNTLNNTTINSLANKTYIKAVTKRYVPGYNISYTTTCTDKLWLLACSEIWNNGIDPYDRVTAGYYGLSPASESNGQYKYYKKYLGSTSCKTITNVTKKPNATSPGYWALRSVRPDATGYWSRVRDYGTIYHDWSIGTNGIAPGFCI